MDLEYGITVHRGIREACPEAQIWHPKGMYLECQPENPKTFLIGLKYGFIQNERIIFGTQGGEHINLKLNCRENLTLSTSPVFLQMKRRMAEDEEDVGDVAVVRFSGRELSLRTPCWSWAVCEGLILSKCAILQLGCESFSNEELLPTHLNITI